MAAHGELDAVSFGLAQLPEMTESRRRCPLFIFITFGRGSRKLWQT